MKRLALLLAAMGIVSAAAFAEAPTLKVTSIGQEIEIENSDGNQDIDSIYYGTTVGLEYGDWSFGVTGAKFWAYDGDDGWDSTDSRLQIDVWNKVTDNLKLGYRYRGQKDFDRHYVRWSFAKDWYYTDGDVWYHSAQNNATDNIEMEVFPIGVKYGNLKVAYFLNYKENIGSLNSGDQEDYIEHQLRVYHPVYTGEKFSLNFEGRFTIAADNGYKGTEPGYRHYDDFGRVRLYLRPSYKVSESLTLWGYYGYEFKDFKYENNDTRDEYTTSKGAGKGASDNYQDIGLGWTYTF
jgi:outer membrane protein G